jgi:CheY-like chemotaxis protein
MSSCPACECENPSHARFCLACGTPLVARCPACEAINVRTREACHHCHAPLPGLLPPADAARAVTPENAPGTPAALDASAEVSISGPHSMYETTDWQVFLREVPELVPERAPEADAEAGSAAGSEASTAPPSDPGADPDAAPTLAPHLAPNLAPTGAPKPDRPAAAEDRPAAEPPAPAAARPLSPVELARRRAEQRAAVRRTQQRRHAVPDAPTLRDVLVLEPDTDARIDLCAVLESFGFRTHVAVTVAEAEGLSLRHRHVAAFLGVGDDAALTAGLCRRLHDVARGRPSALIAVGERDHHADRVQLQLAGADQLLLRPLTRGAIARALMDCGLGLPDDPRHGARPRD